MPALDPSTLDLLPHHRAQLLDLLRTHTPDAQVWAYGSRVTGQAHEGSDLDLVLCNSHDLMQDVAGWRSLQEALQASRLPMLVDVHQWSRLPEAFHANIEAGYVVVWDGIKT